MPTSSAGRDHSAADHADRCGLFVNDDAHQSLNLPNVDPFELLVRVHAIDELRVAVVLASVRDDPQPHGVTLAVLAALYELNYVSEEFLKSVRPVS